MKTWRPIAVFIGCAIASVSWAGKAAQETLRQLTTEKPGSPYQWVGESMEDGTGFQRVLGGTPGPSVADDTVEKDVLASIEQVEQTFGAKGKPTLVEVRQLPKEGDAYSEIWVVRRGTANIVYTVLLTSAPTGGVDIDVNGPWN